MEVLVVSKSFIVRDALNIFFNEEFENCNVIGLRDLEKVSQIDLSKIQLMFLDIENNICNEVKILKQIFTNLKILVFDKNNNQTFKELFKSDIDGYIMDISEKEDLSYIVKRILNNKKYYDMDLLESEVFKQYSCNNTYDDFNKLTFREKEVLNNVVQGLTNKEIAQSLYITDHTVKKHITNILSKLDMKNRKDLIVANQYISID